MKEERGIASENLEKLIIQALDDITPWSGTKEFLSDILIKNGVPLIDNNLFDRLGDEIKLPLREAGDLAMQGNYTEALSKVGEAIAAIGDIKKLTEDEEKRLAAKLMDFIADALQCFLRKKAS
jgi:hypothetical protein